MERCISTRGVWKVVQKYLFWTPETQYTTEHMEECIRTVRVLKWVLKYLLLTPEAQEYVEEYIRTRHGCNRSRPNFSGSPDALPELSHSNFGNVSEDISLLLKSDLSPLSDSIGHGLRHMDS
jgi:hypothetical protein